MTIRYCSKCNSYHRHDLHGEPRKRNRSMLAGWVAFGVFVAMALVAVLGTCR